MNTLETARVGMTPPDYTTVAAAFWNTINGLGAYCDRIDHNANTRYCVWAGQAADGRKHGGRDHPAFPWEGASDQRAFVADDCIEGNVAVLLNALRDSNVIATPTEGGDILRAKTVSVFMRWMRSRMTELEREAEILANFQQETGTAVAHVYWSRKRARRRLKLDAVTLYKTAPALADMVAAAGAGEDMAQNAADVLGAVYPDNKRATLLKAVQAIARGEDAYVTQLATIEDRPRVKAYAFGRNLFVPIGTDELQNAPYIFKVDNYTPAQLRAKVDSDGWNAEWVERAIGRVGDESVYAAAKDNTRFQAMCASAAQQGLVQVVTAFLKTVDDDGIESVVYAVLLPNDGVLQGQAPYAMCESLDTEPVRYPFIEFRREAVSRRLLEARGIPEIAASVQNEVKVQRDARVDRTSLATVPPMLFRAGMFSATAPVEWGPGKQIPLKRLDDVRWADAPRPDTGSLEIERTLLGELRRRFGYAQTEADERDTRARERKLVMAWLQGWRDVFRMVWDLHRQYGREEEVFRVSGSVSDTPERLTREDAQTAYDFTVTLSTLDPEDMTDRLKAFAQIASQFDRDNRVDWAEFCAVALGNIDPSLASRLLRPQQAATSAEMAATRQDLAQIWAGMDIDVAQNANPTLRLQMLDEYVRGSQNIPAQDVQARLQNDPVFAARLNKYRAQLQFIGQQRQNAVTGMLGTPSGNMTPPPVNTEA